MAENQESYSEGGIEVDRQVVSNHAKQIQGNNQLMTSLGLSATPSTYYRNSNGNVLKKQGAPRPDELEEIMGSKMP